jgi:hypothetical protein
MKKIFLSASLLFAMNIAFCQSFMHGAGLTVLGGVASGGDFAFAEGLTYSPRFNFMETETMSVSVGVPLVIGMSGSYNSNYDSYSGTTTENTLGYVLSVPVIVNLNIGRGSTKQNTTRMGYFAGLGYGYHHGDFYRNNSDLTVYSANTSGPVANAGVRIGVGHSYKNVEAKLTFMKGVSGSKPTMIGIAGLFNF